MDRWAWEQLAALDHTPLYAPGRRVAAFFAARPSDGHGRPLGSARNSTRQPLVPACADASARTSCVTRTRPRCRRGDRADRTDPVVPSAAKESRGSRRARITKALVTSTATGQRKDRQSRRPAARESGRASRRGGAAGRRCAGWRVAGRLGTPKRSCAQVRRAARSSRVPRPVASPHDVGGRLDRGRNLAPRRPQLDCSLCKLIHPLVGAMQLSERVA